MKARVLISLQNWEEIKFNEEENLSKCLDQILLSIKLKEKRSLGIEVDENKKDEGKMKLILINKWLFEFKPKSVWTSQEYKCNKSAREGLIRDKSIIEEE